MSSEAEEVDPTEACVAELERAADAAVVRAREKVRMYTEAANTATEAALRSERAASAVAQEFAKMEIVLHKLIKDGIGLRPDKPPAQVNDNFHFARKAASRAAKRACKAEEAQHEATTAITSMILEQDVAVRARARLDGLLE